jgi:hypothetical protein
VQLVNPPVGKFGLVNQVTEEYSNETEVLFVFVDSASQSDDRFGQPCGSIVGSRTIAIDTNGNGWVNNFYKNQVTFINANTHIVVIDWAPCSGDGCVETRSKIVCRRTFRVM